MNPEPTFSCGLLLAALACGGCSGHDESLPAPPPATTSAPTDVAQSHKANMRFKRDLRLRNDFAAALELDPDDLCNELDRYSCTDVAHRVALGGVQPYDLGIVEPAAATGATTPLVVERIALAACSERVDRDLSAPASAVIFADLPVDAGGAIADIGHASVAGALQRLYRRALQRNPSSGELDHLRGFYSDVAARTPDDAARKWATLSCFVVLTSMESLFY